MNPALCPNCARELDPLLGETVCGACVARLRGLLGGIPDQVVREAEVVQVRTAAGRVVRRRAVDGEVVLPGLSASLDAAARGELRFGDVGPVTRTADRRLPLVPAAVYARDELVRVLAEHASAIARSRAWPRPARELCALAVWLRDQLGWLAFHDDGPARVSALTEAVVLARAVVEHPHDDRAFRGRCDALVEGETCGASLYARPTAAVAECRRCGAEHDVSTQRDRLLAEARARVMTATQAARALQGLGIPVSPSSIRSWVHRGALAPQGSVRSTAGRTPVYRLGDVERLARRKALEAARHAARYVGSQDA